MIPLTSRNKYNHYHQLSYVVFSKLSGRLASDLSIKTLLPAASTTKPPNHRRAMAVTADSGDNGEKMILLISSDGERFELSEAAASQSKTLSHTIEDDCTDNGVLVGNFL
jgi:S-phase kinase-associated protein 1